MKLVFIHGRDQQGRDPGALQKLWVDSFKLGLDAAGHPWPADIKVVFPYYGDRLVQLAAEIDGPSTAIAKGASAGDAKLLEFQHAALEEIARATGISDEQVRAHLVPEATEKGVQNWAWVQALLRAIEERGKTGELVLSAVTRDVFLYLTNQNVRTTLNELVGASLAGDEPTVVVAHSLGTVVAYELLRQSVANLDIRALITLGSPLGLKTVRNYVKRPLARPSGVRVWKNARDTADVVALYPLDKTTWNIEPLIENHDGVSNHSDNRHGIVGYLDDKVVAGWIYQALTKGAE